MTITEILKNIKSDLLTEDVTKEVSTLFEASVSEKVEAKITEIEKQFEDYKNEEIVKLEEKTKKYIDSYLVEEVSNYIKFAVEEFITENKLETENGIKAEMFNKLIVGMKTVLSENNVEVNEAKGIEKIEEDLKTSKEGYNNIAKENLKLKDKNQLLESGLIFEKLSKDMSVEEKEKFGKMVSDFETDDLKLFDEKATIVKENIISGKSPDDDKKGDDNIDDNTDNNNDSNFTPDSNDDTVEEAMSI